MIVAIHQPNYLPWLGFFYKIARCDCFVVLDDVQYVRRSYISRTRIKTPHGVQWLTIPVHVKGQYSTPIRQMRPRWDLPWVKDHLRSFELNYRRTPHYRPVMDEVIAPVLEESGRGESDLATLNTALIRRVCGFLGISTPMVDASRLNVRTASTERLIELVRLVGGTTYWSGSGGAKYQNPSQFAAAGIELRYSDFDHPRYDQPWGGFEPGLSVVDALFCCGREAAAFLEAPGAAARAAVPFGSAGVAGDLAYARHV